MEFYLRFQKMHPQIKIGKRSFDVLHPFFVKQMEFYLCFQKMHPQIKIGKRSFDVLHPFFVKQMKEWNVCCCIYHVEINEL
jgi:hypothetical protein